MGYKASRTKLQKTNKTQILISKFDTARVKRNPKGNVQKMITYY